MARLKTACADGSSMSTAHWLHSPLSIGGFLLSTVAYCITFLYTFCMDLEKQPLKSEAIVVRFEPRDLELIRRVAKVNNMYPSTVVREIVLKALGKPGVHEARRKKKG